MAETVDQRIAREWEAYRDCEHEWLPAVKDSGPLTGWYRQCGKCKCWTRALAALERAP